MKNMEISPKNSLRAHLNSHPHLEFPKRLIFLGHLDLHPIIGELFSNIIDLGLSLRSGMDNPIAGVPLIDGIPFKTGFEDQMPVPGHLLDHSLDINIVTRPLDLETDLMVIGFHADFIYLP